MTKEEQALMALGREVHRIVGDVVRATKGDEGYARRRISFRDGTEFHVFVVKGAELADVLDEAAARSKKYIVTDTTPPSKVS